jgi:hypothetical protein
MARKIRTKREFVSSEIASATSESQLRGLIAHARTHGTKFVIPTSMAEILTAEAKAGDPLAIEALEVCCVVHEIPVGRKA